MDKFYAPMAITNIDQKLSSMRGVSLQLGQDFYKISNELEVTHITGVAALK